MSQCFDCLISFCYYLFIYSLLLLLFSFFCFCKSNGFFLWHYIMHLVRGSNVTVVVNFVVGDIKMAGAVPKTLTEGGG